MSNSKFFSQCQNVNGGTFSEMFFSEFVSVLLCPVLSVAENYQNVLRSLNYSVAFPEVTNKYVSLQSFKSCGGNGGVGEALVAFSEATNAPFQSMVAAALSNVCPPQPFTGFSKFEKEMLIVIGTATALVALGVFLIARCCYYECKSSHPAPSAVITPSVVTALTPLIDMNRSAPGSELQMPERHSSDPSTGATPLDSSGKNFAH